MRKQTGVARLLAERSRFSDDVAGAGVGLETHMSMINPLHVEVADGFRGLRFTAVNESGDTPQLVRIHAVSDPRSKSAGVREFEPLELWPHPLQPLVRTVRPIAVRTYWLAILAFCRVGSSWERMAGSLHTARGVPAQELRFALPEARGAAGDVAMALSVTHAGEPDGWRIVN